MRYFAIAAMFTPLLLVLAVVAGDPRPGYEQMRSHTVIVSSPHGRGTGAFLDDRHVLTARHGVNPDMPIMVETHDGKAVAATIAWKLDEMDLALLELAEPVPGRHVVARCSPLRMGEPVHLLHNPLNSNWLHTEGNVASMHMHGSVMRYNHVVVNAPAGPGSSGGPMFDARGRLVGVLMGASSMRGVVVSLFSLVIPMSNVCGIPEVRRHLTVADEGGFSGS